MSIAGNVTRFIETPEACQVIYGVSPWAQASISMYQGMIFVSQRGKPVATYDPFWSSAPTWKMPPPPEPDDNCDPLRYKKQAFRGLEKIGIRNAPHASPRNAKHGRR